MKEINPELFRFFLHEITNNSSSINSLCEILSTYLQKDKKALDLVEEIRQRNLVSVKSFSTFNLLDRELSPDTSSLVKPFSDVIIKVIRALCIMYRAKEMGYIITPNESLLESPLLRINQDHLDLIVYNLIGNAFKYGHRFSNVVIRTEASKGKPFIFHIINYGQAWSESEESLLFQKFYRGAHAKEIDEGVGLGLYVARQIGLAYGIVIDKEKPLFLSKYNLSLAHFLLNSLDQKDTSFLSSEEEQQIRRDISQLSHQDLYTMFLPKQHFSPPRWLALNGPFTVLWIRNNPTYRIEFTITIPAHLLAW